MRRFFIVFFTAAFFLAAPNLLSAQNTNLELDLGDLVSKAKEVVNINLDKNTINWAAQSLNAQGVDKEKLQELMKELGGINVQVLEFEEGKAPAWEELMAAAQRALKVLDGPQWQSIISVKEQDKDGPQIVRISLFKDSAGEPGGLALLVIESKELVLISLTGKVRLDQLGILGKALGQPGIMGSNGDK